MGRSQIAVITSKYTFLIFFCGIICKLKNDSYLCSALREKHYLTVVLERWQSGRCGGLENRCTARYPGFESLSLR